jgi:subtilase family serine protease
MKTPRATLFALAAIASATPVISFQNSWWSFIFQQPREVYVPPATVKPSAAVHRHRTATSRATTGPVGYSPTQIRHAYGIDQLPNGGAGRTIAIIVPYGSPTIQSDLNTFSTQYGLPSTTLHIINNNPSTTAVDAGWALETSLDVEWSHAVAPQATIILSIARSASLDDLMTAVDAAVAAGANVVTMSWGSAEFNGQSAYESHFNRTGVAFFASSGDSGSAQGTSWPAASPSVTAVGGTTLQLDTAGNRLGAEVAWSGSGGGFSAIFARPTYQNGWNSNTNRAYPDVSAIADPATGVSVYDSTPYNGTSGWWAVGGTSASSPIVSAMYALADELRVAQSLHPTSQANPSLYSLAGATNQGVAEYSLFFDDITSGNTGIYAAGTGYDEATGLGSPIAQNLLAGIALLPDSGSTTPTPTPPTPTPPTPTPTPPKQPSPTPPSPTPPKQPCPTPPSPTPPSNDHDRDGDNDRNWINNRWNSWRSWWGR